MPNIPRRFILVIALVLLGVVVGVYFIIQSATQNNAAMIVSGTIEVTEIHLGTEMGGRVYSVLVEEGQSVRAGDVLIELDLTLN